MRRCFVPLVSLSALFVSACGGSLCDRAAALDEELIDKLEECLTIAERTEFASGTLSKPQQEQCEERQREASDAQREALEAILDAREHCLRLTPRCESRADREKVVSDFETCMRDF